MPDINKVYIYTEAEKSVIKQKKSTIGFTYQNWSDDDLLNIRSNLRNHYRDEQKGICCYCRDRVSLMAATNSPVEHIAPKSLYPDFIFETKNMCVICADCNEIKRHQEVMAEAPDTVKDGSGRKAYPRSANSFKIVHPHLDEYNDHIIRIGQFYVDKSDKGSFTIGACKLNRYIRKFGWEPELLNIGEVFTMIDALKTETSPVQQRLKLMDLQEKLMKINL